jgi:hypothetical protein
VKYIIVRNPAGFERVFFALSPVAHSDLAAAFAREPDRVVSAGFVEFYVEAYANCVRTFGRSESLNLEPRPQDARLIGVLTHATLQAALAAEPVLPAINATVATL